MLKFALATSAALVASAALTMDAQAQTASPKRCAEYAKTAVAQYNKFIAIPGCFDLAPVPRWHANYSVHYNWCINGRDQAADFEEGFRNKILADCKARVGH